MIRIDEIQDELLHLIGWQQNYDTSSFKIDDSLTESKSGLYFQQVHPLLTLQNLQCIAPDFQNIKHEEFAVDKKYLKGSIVECRGKLYRALRDCEGYAPVPDATVCDLVYKIKPVDEGGYERVGEPKNINCRDYDSRYRKVSETTTVVTDTADMMETVKFELVDIEPGAAEPYDPEEYWVEVDLFSEWLADKTKASIYKAVMRFISEKLSSGTGTALCENRALFDGTGRLADKVKNRGRFVGFEIVPVRSKGVTTKINRIGLQFTKPGKYTLYLFHSSAYKPVRVIEVEKKTANSTEWFSIPDLYLPYVTGMTDAGGSWYIGYLQNDLPEGSEAIRRERDWSKGPCKSCSRQEFLAWEAWSKYIEVHPFHVDEQDVINRQYKLVYTRVRLLGTGGDDVIDEYGKDYMLVPSDLDVKYRKDVIGTQDGAEWVAETPIIAEGTGVLPIDEAELDNLNLEPRMWDIENNIYTYDNNYGLNLEVSVGCDFTDFIISQSGMFQEVIAKQVAVDMLREFAFNANVRTNRHSISASRVDILYEIDGDSSSMKKSGLSNQLDQAFKALRIDTSGIDRICLPCKNNGVKYRTV